MDKQSLILILDECFEEEGNVAILHFNDGSELLINSKPLNFSSHMRVNSSYNVSMETINEQFIIPFSSVLYVTLSNVENLKILSKQYEHVSNDLEKELDNVFFDKKLSKDIE